MQVKKRLPGHSVCPGPGPTTRERTRWTRRMGHWASVGLPGKAGLSGAWLGKARRHADCMDQPAIFPPTSSDSTARADTDPSHRPQNRISPSEEPRTSLGGSEAFEKPLRRQMKQVTSASDVPLSAGRPPLLSNEPRVTSLLKHCNSCPTIGRVPLRTSTWHIGQSNLPWLTGGAKFHLVLGTVWSSPDSCACRSQAAGSIAS
jgi:hypothetical protein